MKEEESESESVREAGVGRRIVKETLFTAADEEDMVANGTDDWLAQVANTAQAAPMAWELQWSTAPTTDSQDALVAVVADPSRASASSGIVQHSTARHGAK